MGKSISGSYSQFVQEVLTAVVGGLYGVRDIRPHLLHAKHSHSPLSYLSGPQLFFSFCNLTSSICIMSSTYRSLDLLFIYPIIISILGLLCSELLSPVHVVPGIELGTSIYQADAPAFQTSPQPNFLTTIFWGGHTQ